jgi:hypothetical protein
MKTKTIVFLNFIFFTFLSFNSISNQTIQDNVVVGVYDGKEDYGYNFIVTDEYDEEHTMTFQKVNEELLSKFDLKSEALIGTSFKIEYNITIKKSKDEYGFDDETEIFTIKNLEKL